MGCSKTSSPRPIDPDADGSNRYAVIAGGRRLTALVDLAREGVLASDHPVPCRMVGNGAADNELSLAENVVRVAMHPADRTHRRSDEKIEPAYP